MIWNALRGGNGRRLLLYVDGAIRPHATGLGVVVRERSGRVVAWRSKRLPRAMTCNQAEYEALILGLEVARALRLDQVEVRSDSQVVVNQMLGRFSVRKRALRHLHARASAAVAALDDVELMHVPRERNRLADALAHEAADGEWELRTKTERERQR
jgi:ribonuclease HI